MAQALISWVQCEDGDELAAFTGCEEGEPTAPANYPTRPLGSPPTPKNVEFCVQKKQKIKVLRSKINVFINKMTFTPFPKKGFFGGGCFLG